MTEYELLEIAGHAESWFNDQDRPHPDDGPLEQNKSLHAPTLYRTADLFATAIGNLLAHIDSQAAHISRLEQAIRDAHWPAPV